MIAERRVAFRRTFLRVCATAAICVVICAGLAMWMASSFNGAVGALQWLQSVRPALAAGQLAALALLWVCWADAIAAMGRRFAIAAPTVAHLQASRLRLWTPLAACVALNATRAFSG